MKKKVISLFIVATLVLTNLVCPVMAETVGPDLQGVSTVKRDSTTVETVSGSSGIDNISDEQEFAKIFLANSSSYSQRGTGTDVSPAVNVTYDYEMSYDAGDDLYYVTMLISFLGSGHSYSTTVYGSLTSTKVSEETVFLSGPLCGELSVSGVPFTIIVGFNKVLDNDGFSGCVTIFTTDGIETADTFLRFHIAENVMTKEIISYLVNYSESQDNVVQDSGIMPTAIGTTNSGFVKRGSTLYGKLQNVSSSVNAQKSEIYFKPGVNASNAENVIDVSISSFCSDVNQAVAGFSTYYTRVNSLSVELGSNSSVPIVEDFWLYDEHGLQSVGTQNNVGSELGDCVLQLLSIVFSLAPAEYQAVAAFLSALSPTATMVNTLSNSFTSGSLSTHKVRFGAGGASFDNYPYQIAHLLSGTRSTGSYSYYATVQVVYGTLDDSGLSYVYGVPQTHNFTINFVHV